ncbi:hypothetical protein EMCRGX_G032743 [Ephydatia muelleri]
MSGIHVLHAGTFTIENLSDITFIGLGSYVQRSLEEKVNEFHFSPNIENDTIITFLEPTAIIQCTNSSGFLFSNITNLSLINLTIANCGANVMNTLLQVHEANPIIDMKPCHYVAILMVNITNLVIETTSIQNSTAMARNSGIEVWNVYGDLHSNEYNSLLETAIPKRLLEDWANSRSTDTSFVALLNERIEDDIMSFDPDATRLETQLYRRSLSVASKLRKTRGAKRIDVLFGSTITTIYKDELFPAAMLVEERSVANDLLAEADAMIYDLQNQLIFVRQELTEAHETLASQYCSKGADSFVNVNGNPYPIELFLSSDMKVGVV